MKIYLIGYMASGKTRLGNELALKTGYPFIDIDDLFEERYRITVYDFFEKYDEDSFRKIERDLLIETLSFADAIISTGGGTPCFFDNMDIIKTSGISIYLKPDVGMLIARLNVVRKKRPLLKDMPAVELDRFVRRQVEEREPFYSRADYTVHSDSIDTETLYSLVAGLQ